MEYSLVLVLISPALSLPPVVHLLTIQCQPLLILVTYPSMEHNSSNEEATDFIKQR